MACNPPLALTFVILLTGSLVPSSFQSQQLQQQRRGLSFNSESFRAMCWNALALVVHQSAIAVEITIRYSDTEQDELEVCFPQSLFHQEQQPQNAKSSKHHVPTLTNLLLYLMRFMARPLGCFFLSCFCTFGVCPRTFPARAKDPCTLPAKHLTSFNYCQPHLAKHQ